MKWFEGTIPEAIQSSKAKNAVFVVFIQGNDDVSKQVTTALDTPQVSSKLESDKFVAIKLLSDSENYTFFAKIYQFVPVPSIFFIGKNGSPLEIIGSALSADELATKIDSILEKANPQSKDSSENLPTEQKPNASDNSPSADNSQSSSANAESDLVPTEEEKAMMDTGLTKTEKTMSQQDKIKRARELIELQKKKKQEEEERKEREREIERRKLGKDLQKMRQELQDKEIREAHQERLREKAAEQAAREKILRQIAEDKLERKRKHELQQQEKNAQQQKQKVQEDAQAKAKPQPPTGDLSKTRIQFKLPTGNNITGTFESTNTLGSLRSYVSQNANLPFRQFSMSAFFPRKDFTTSDDDKTLLELDLAPSSVILILPVKSNNTTSVVKSNDGPGIFSLFFWTLLSPVVTLYNVVMGYFTGRPRAGESDSNNDAPGFSGNSNTPFGRLAANMGMRRLGSQGTTKVRARGNVHTLHSNDNDNDENNTWNGNSTQQM